MATNYGDWLDAPGVIAPKRTNTFTGPGTPGAVPVAPTPAPENVAGQVGLDSGFTPDYKSLILSDPGYLAWQNNAALDVSQAAAQRKAALQALAIRYGGLAGGFTDRYGDIDPTTLDLAGKNEQSDLARVGRQYDQGVEAFKKSLAARGALQSGDLGYGLDQLSYGKQANEFDLAQRFSDAAQAAINNYLGAEQGSRQGQWQAIQGAEQSVFSNPLNMPSVPTTATLHPDWESKYGEPVYVGPDGQLYALDASGHPVPYSPGYSSGAAPAPIDYTQTASNVGTLSPEQLANNPGTTADQTYVDPGFYTWSGDPNQALVDRILRSGSAYAV